MRHLLILISLFLLGGTGVTQSAALSCKAVVNDPSNTAEYLRCLDDQLGDVREERDILREALMAVIGQQHSLLDQSIRGGDAEPDMVPLGSFVYATRAFWGGGTVSTDIVCRNYNSSIAGYQLVLSTELIAVNNRGTCAVAPYCDSTGEFCRDVVVKGCFVKPGVLESLRGKFALDDNAILAMCN